MNLEVSYYVEIYFNWVFILIHRTFSLGLLLWLLKFQFKQKLRKLSEGKMECFANVENENLPMKILLVTGKCLRELCLNLSGSSVIINYKSHYLLALTRLTKEFRLHAILLLASLHHGEGPLLYRIDRSQAGFM